ncbi:Zinc finger protein 618 isoform X10 [Aix galericulata]|nr:Zinc finger protein 618 isoform X10 [Aix galericulata]
MMASPGLALNQMELSLRSRNRDKPLADESNSTGRRSSSSRECLKRSPRSPKAEGSDSVTSQSSPSEEAGMMTEVKVKTEVPDDYIEEVIWQDDAKDSKKNIKDGPGDVPAEICVVIGGVRNQQTLGSYECGICGKKYKYYNCFQTHVRAHRDTEAASDNFRYTCDICGKKYKYYSCFQEHRDLHAVDDPYDQAVIAADEVKEEEPEPFQKIGPKTGNYTCEFCGKQYKYYTPYQEHVALHAPIKFSRSPLFVAVKTQGSQSSKKTPSSINRCSTLLHRTPSGVPPASPSQMFRAPNSGSPGSKAITAESAFSRRAEGKAQNNFEETNSNSQNSSAVHSGTEKPKEKRCKQNPSEPYTCGACGIQFQFYNNLLEHMQSHAADNENNIASSQPRSPLAVVEEKWKPQLQRNNANNTSASGSVGNSAIPEKERQNIAERLLRVMCTDLGALSVVSGKEFIKHSSWAARQDLCKLSELVPLGQFLTTGAKLLIFHHWDLYPRGKLKQILVFEAFSSASSSVLRSCSRSGSGAAVVVWEDGWGRVQGQAGGWSPQTARQILPTQPLSGPTVACLFVLAVQEEPVTNKN